MVVCRNCHRRVGARTLDIRPFFTSLEESFRNDDLKTDPSNMVVTFRCINCNINYTFTRTITSDELRELNNNKNSSSGCGGCGS